MILDTHRRLFTAGRPSIAGRFRDEDLRVGGDGRHGFSPPSPQALRDELYDVWECVITRDNVPGDAARFARWAAEFLERFLFVHPFADGNGRLARLYVERRAYHCGWFVSWPGSGRLGRRAEKKYIRALEYAHVQANRCGNRVQRKDPYRPLAMWLEPLLELRATVEEAPPGFEL